MKPDPEQVTELEEAFHGTAEAEDAAFLQGQNSRKWLALIATLVAVIAGGVLVGWAIYTSVRKP